MSYLNELTYLNVPTLGMLVWYNVSSDASISQEAFLKLRREHKAPVAFIKPPKPANVFRRACESIQGKWEGNGVVYDMLTKDLGYSANLVKREIRATDGKNTLTLGTLVFDKARNKCTLEDYVNAVSNAHTEMEALAIYGRVGEFMTANADTIHSLPIRESIRKSIEGKLNGVLVKPGGGLYFVPLRNYNSLDNLVQMMDTIPGVTICVAPLVEDAKQKSMLQYAAEDHIGTAAGELHQELRSLVNPTAKKLNEIGKEIAKLQKKSQDYGEIVDDHIDSCLYLCQELLDGLWVIDE